MIDPGLAWTWFVTCQSVFCLQIIIKTYTGIFFSLSALGPRSVWWSLPPAAAWDSLTWGHRGRVALCPRGQLVSSHLQRLQPKQTGQVGGLSTRFSRDGCGSLGWM